MFKITEMTQADLKEVLLLEESIFRAPWSMGLFQAELASPLSACRVARMIGQDGEMIVGYLISKTIRDETHLESIAVREDFRNRGIGSLLLDDMLAVAVRNRVEKIHLEVRRSNLAALELYKKAGFVQCGIRWNYYPETGEDALLMTLVIGDRGGKRIS